jgi:hypothetical protein
VATVTGRSVSEIKTAMKESASNAKGEHLIEDAEVGEANMRGGLVVSTKNNMLKREDTEVNGDSTPSVTTKSGRASKPSTPAIPSFPEPQRSRSSREQATAKRSHKKGAGAAAQLLAESRVDSRDEEMQLDGDEGEVEEDEPTYCYCNGVSYGEMVACDADGCAKEWFHLECVGLKVAPKTNGMSLIPPNSILLPTSPV